MKEKVNGIVKAIIKQLLKIFYIFPLKPNTIYLLSFGGKSDYGFDAKALVEYSNKNNLDYKFIWGYKGKKPSINHRNVKYVKINSLQGLFYVLTSKIFITNINPYPYIPYRQNQLIINTWHGYAFKKCGKYIPGFDNRQFNLSTCFLSHAKFYSDKMLIDSFEYKREILNIGTPRNDIMFDLEGRKLASEIVRNNYSIPSNCKILMYAPTFRRDYETSKINLDMTVIKSKIEEKFHCKCVIIYRLHPLIAKDSQNAMDDGIDVSLYPDMQDLICTADFLISDYSSCIWDFGLTKKPVFIYAEDYESYKNDRGLYCPLEETPYPLAQNQKELCENIESFDNSDYLEKVDEYYSRIGTYENGKACEKLYQYIVNRRIAND